MRSATGEALAVLLLAVLLDRLGEPPSVIHPVVAIGRLIQWWTDRAPARPPAQLAYGALLVVGTAVVAGGVVALIDRLLRPWPLVRLLVVAVLLKTTFAQRALIDAASAVQRPLAQDDLPASRAALRSLVSRERASLDAGQVAAAAIESVAENVGDSVVAPLLAYAVGGVPLAMAYRAVNTADAMIGYRGRFEHLGKASARLDDLLNVLPARVSALCIVAGAGDRAPAAWRVARRDHGLTVSPNAGWPMAAMAGALDVSLEKAGHYTLNAHACTATAADLSEAMRLATMAAWLGTTIAAIATAARAKRASSTRSAA